MPLYRQGDVLIETIDKLPEGCVPLKKLVLASGEVTGHRHQMRERKAARLYSLGSLLYLEVLRDETVVHHPEHRPIALGRGVYRVWQQREFVNGFARTVFD
jgi:hypothetical protein